MKTSKHQNKARTNQIWRDMVWRLVMIIELELNDLKEPLYILTREDRMFILINSLSFSISLSVFLFISRDHQPYK